MLERNAPRTDYKGGVKATCNGLGYCPSARGQEKTLTFVKTTLETSLDTEKRMPKITGSAKILSHFTSENSKKSKTGIYWIES